MRLEIKQLWLIQCVAMEQFCSEVIMLCLSAKGRVQILSLILFCSHLCGNFYSLHGHQTSDMYSGCIGTCPVRCRVVQSNSDGQKTTISPSEEVFPSDRSSKSVIRSGGKASTSRTLWSDHGRHLSSYGVRKEIRRVYCTGSV